jgi:ABC-2 type transport system ATP-binding protein
MVVVDDVSKWFGDLVAVSEVSCSIGPGVTALLGPNGAGKSTIMRVICGLTPPSRGSVRILGQDPRRSLDLLRRVALVPQQDAVFEVLDGLGFVRLGAVLHQLPDPDAAARRAMALVELDPDDARPITTYSKGMRQRAKVAHALVHDPSVIVLDEPLTGLDPRQRIHMIDLFHRLGAEGRCVIVSSHVLEEVERFGSRVLVIAQGRLAAEGDFRAIRDLMDDRPLRVRVRAEPARPLASRLIDTGTAVAVRLVDERTIVVDTHDVVGFRGGIALLAQEAGVRLHEIVPLDDDLESVFRYLVEGR